ncbi:RNA-directed DNA polymerase, eukaryota [Tanacetum coccineum]
MARGGSMLSNASLLERLSCNIFITNFPAKLSANDLWNTCAQYGTVLDVYISLKVTKNGKRFAFARFNKVNDVDLLIRNLRSVWMESFHLFANVARFNRDTKVTSSQKSSSFNPSKVLKPSFAKVVKGSGVNENYDAPVLVLERGLLNYEGDPVLVGCVKDFKTLPNIHTVCSSEGFSGLKISYLGEFWVLLEFDSFQTCEKFHTHEGIKSWFSTLSQWTLNFEIQDRVVWIDIEGTSFRVWSQSTYNKIASKWGELVYMDTSNVPNKYNMRLCVKTKVQHLIAESFKVILEGKVSIVRAKEVIVGKHDWVEEEDDNEVVQDSFQSHVNVTTREEYSNVKSSNEARPLDNLPEQVITPSEDPFGIEDLILKTSKVHKKDAPVTGNSEPEFPPGFTPLNSVHKVNETVLEQVIHDHSSVHKKDAPVTGNSEPEFPPGFTPLNSIHKVNETVPEQVIHDHSSVQRSKEASNNVVDDGITDFELNNKSYCGSKLDHTDSMAHCSKPINGFSILERFQEFITIGQAMGYDMKGCEKDYRRIITTFWGNMSFDFATSSARGRSGGILCVWDNTLFQKKRVYSNEHCLCVEGTWLATNSDLLFISVYSPQELTLKRALWAYMTDIISRWHGEVVAMGDFNEVRYASERHGSTFYASNAAEFNMFIVNSHLNEIPLGGYSFTWSDKYANKMYHRPILLKESHVDYGPTPFRLFHSWFLEDDFTFAINKKDSVDLAQKAKVKWAIEGDENTKFFHGIVNKKIRHLAIKGILIDSEWIDNPTRVKSEFYNHFANRFSAPNWTWVPFDDQFPSCLNIDHSCDLERDVTIEEIKRVVWDCGSDKSPCPDGFTFEFFKKYWSIVGNDVVNAVKEFFSSSTFPNGCNPSFIALIPKVLDAKHLNDFRPISLVGCQYKIIGKILANRLSLVIDDIISQEQSAFVKGRQIMDGPIIVNEVIAWYKSKKEQSFLFKVDFQKAFDSVLPIKLNIFMWRMLLDKLPTRSNLAIRGLDVPCSLCPNCGTGVETCDHLFFVYPMALDLFRLLGRWWNIQIPILLDPSTWESWLNSLRLNSLQKLVMEASFSSL